MTREQTMKDKYGKDVYEKWGTKGGKAKVKKGVATLSKEQRAIRAKEAAGIRWTRYREIQEATKNA
jgi:hypothetical protein